MHAVKLMTRIDATHRLMLDLPADTPEGEAEVIVLIRSANAPPASTPQAGQSLLDFFAELDQRPGRKTRSREDIEAQITAERDSWD
jgi:hypothetical protein